MGAKVVIVSPLQVSLSSWISCHIPPFYGATKRKEVSVLPVTVAEVSHSVIALLRAALGTQ